jgi:hypothetical protein
MQHQYSTIAAILLGSLAVPAHGAVHFFTDRSSWTQAVQNPTSVPASGIAPAGGVADFSGPSGMSVAGVTLIGPSADLSGFDFAVVDPAFKPDLYDWGAGPVFRGSQPVGKQHNLAYGLIRIVLPSGVTAAGFDYMAISGKAESFIFQVSSGDTQRVKSSAKPQSTFFGFTSDTPVSEIRIASSAQPLIANVVFAPGPQAKSRAVDGRHELAALLRRRRTA